MYFRAVARRSSSRRFLVLMICVALLPLADLSLLVRSEAQQNPPGRGARPRPGKPEGDLPDLEEVKSESSIEREPPAAIPSTVRSPKLSLKPWDGRRVGDPEPRMNTDPADKQVRRAHARVYPPPLPDDQFVQNFFTWALLRSASSSEQTYWNDQLRVAYGQGQTSLKLSAIELGKTLFESAEYAARQRDNHWYVYDLYKTYLMRDPDSTGWTNWENSVPTMGRENVRRGFEESTEFAGLIATITPNGSASANAASLISARVDPRNQPGNGMLTRDANWSVPLLSLPGRAGLDLGLALSYSSLVWTRSGPYIYFDEDNGFPSPGFKLGFPTIPLKVFDAQTARNAYLLITASGKRVALRQVGTSNIYEASDSSYLRLTESGGNLLVNATDGTKLTLTYSNNEYRCSEIKDRNGNYITVNYNSLGRLTNITDTLGRLITFNYDTNANLLSITQAWNGQPSHQWVSFGWGTRTMQSSFTSGAVVGTANGTVLPVITQVNLNDTSSVTFDYTNSLQVSVIRKNFGVIDLNATTFTYETPAGDAPRLTDSRVSARNWTGINGLPAEVITTYSSATDRSWAQLTAPDGTVYKELFATSGWQTGLTTGTEVWSAGVKKKWTTTSWTQDDTSVSYQKNPRAYDVSIYDEAGNRRRTETVYTSFNLPNPVALPTEVKEYAADALTVLRRATTTYFTSQAYIDRRVLGLVRESMVYDGNNNPQSRVWYDYDWSNDAWVATPQPATQHESGSDPAGRGNLCWIGRWDVTDLNNPDKVTRSYIKYNRTGSVIRTEDHYGHGTSISYADSFSDSVNRNTFAYPTTITDADGFSSYAQYNYDFGATTRTQAPAPAGQSQGAIQTLTYNNLGQLERVTTTNNGAYKRFWYGGDYVASFATVNNVADELYSVQATDGLGRIMRVAGNHPGSSGGYWHVTTIYDQMGRAWKVSNPTEVNGAWQPSGDDAAGMYYTQQTYDWKGRPLVTTNPDNTTKEASYSGCGCAGGEVVTLTDEGTIDGGVAKRRQQKIYSDVLGRTVKTEILNWQGGTVYSGTVNTYNARDQITSVREYQGTDASGVYQETLTSYDGFGRVKTQHVPGQNPGTNTTWDYNSDDTIQKITDPRGAATNLTYNNRHLVSNVTFTAPAGITIPAPISFVYDGVSNRSSMTDGVGTVTYHYDQLARMDWEDRTFTGLSGTFRLSYGYNLAGALTSLSEPSQFGMTTSYNYDAAGQLTSVTGSGSGSMPQYMSGIQYRAWGATKHINYGSGAALDVTYNSRLLPTYYSLGPVYRGTYPPGYTTMGTENQYHPDGRIRYARDLQDGTFDRSYFYDQVTRLATAYSGREARGFPPSGYSDCPFQQSYSYDVWGNMSRTGHHWGSPVGDVPSYSNNRRSDWTYDASGNVLTRDYGWKVHSYNAAGQQQTYDESGIQSTDTGYYYYDDVINHTYNGDGDAGKRLESHYAETENGVQHDYTDTTYYVRSSVLGGVEIVGLNQWGGKSEGHVYVDDQKLTDQFGLRNVNPATGVWVSTYNAGGVIGGTRAELDPLGAEVGESNPYVFGGTYEGLIGLESLYEERGNPFDLGGGCALDGLPISCSEFRMRLQGGSVARESTVLETKLAQAPVLRNKESPSGALGKGAAYERVLTTYWNPVVPIGINLFQTLIPSIKHALVGIGNNNEGDFLDWGEEVESLPQQSGEQLSSCLRNALRQFFPSQTAQGQTYSPVDDSRFKNWIPSWIRHTTDPDAVTLGLYDIHYDPNRVSIDGGDVEDLKTVIEEVSHAVQFLQVWAGLKQRRILQPNVGYGAAQSAWQNHYFYYSVKGIGYDNDVERWAKKNTDSIINNLRSHAPSNKSQVCGFNLY